MNSWDPSSSFSVHWASQKHRSSPITKERAHLAIGFVVLVLVASVGGPTGPAVKPGSRFWTSYHARDFAIEI